jgi:putative CocE/NonD family hydrolase
MASDIQTQPRSRGILGQAIEPLLSWFLGLPAERCNFTTQALSIPISDSLSRIELRADLFQPLLDKPLGTVLVRSPYGRGIPIAIPPRQLAARGYQVLVVSCRGTFGSGGEFDAFRTEVQDGKGVVEWMRKQPWYTGTFATIGGSYIGYVQWALLYDPPKDMVAAVPGVAPHDFAQPIWGTGALDLDIVRWADMIVHQEDSFSLWEALCKTRTRRLETLFEGTTPLASNIQAHLEGKFPWMDKVLTKPDLSDPFYEPMKLGRALGQAEIPTLIIAGWFDLFVEQSIEQYLRLKEQGCNVALTVGPWSHTKSVVATEMIRHGFDWIEEHLGNRAEAKRSAAVQYFVTGAQEWKSASDFPPRTESTTFFLHEGGKLAEKPLSASSGSSTFTFDPRNPTPEIGGNALITGGRVNDTALAKRSDVLVFDTAPLEEDTEICGKPAIQLAHSTSSPYVDVFVRVSEVDAKGRSHNITETYKRLNPKRADDEELKLALNFCAHRFLKGTKIRVIIAGGNFPQYAKNHGVENSDLNGTEMIAVDHTIHHSESRISNIVFPVVRVPE